MNPNLKLMIDNNVLSNGNTKIKAFNVMKWHIL